jgi:ubiquinone/menaquinone biosynthesis C-methylase UbiE
VSWRKLPAAEQTFDAVFLIFVAHEFRIAEVRHQFLSEVARILKPGGSLVMVEHLRDVPNFLAFGPGFLHFHSRQSWTRAFRAAHLTVQSEQTVTPFVHVFEARA